MSATEDPHAAQDALEERLRAQEYLASLERRETARKRRLAALRGNPQARQALENKFRPLSGPNDDGRQVTGGSTG